jgi:CheY-like chemotaxis protein
MARRADEVRAEGEEMNEKAAVTATKEMFPLDKRDLHYDPSSGEVSMKREKFDAFVKYTQGLLEQLEQTEDARDFALYRARKAGQTTDVLEALREHVDEATAAIRSWLQAPGHTIQKLSEKTGIPYATCYRIVNERLGTSKLEIGYLETIISAVGKGRSPLPQGAGWFPRFKQVLIGLPKGFEAGELVSSWQTKGSEVSTARGGPEIFKRMGELNPDLIVVDVSMPNLGKNGLEELKAFAKNTKGTIVLTGEMAEANSALVQGSFERPETMDRAVEIQNEREAARG